MTGKITAKVVRRRTDSFELELVLGTLQLVKEGLWVLHGSEQIIYICADVLSMGAIISHPDAAISATRLKSHIT
jgi:hypothetical protein